MKVLQVGVLGIVLGLGILACGMFSGVSGSNPSPTLTNVDVVPTVTALPIPTRKSLPTQASIPNSQAFTLSESDLNQQLTRNLPQDGTVSNVHLDLHEGNTANVSATVRVNSLTLQPDASVQVVVTDGRIAIDVLQVNVGGFGVPRSMIEPQIADLKTMAETELNKQLATLETNSGLKLRAITTTEDSMTLYFAP